MSDHSTPKADGDGAAPVRFTEDEHKQLCSAVAASVSATLGGLPVSVGFNVEDAAFLVEVVGRVAPGDKN